MVDWLTVWGVVQATGFVFKPILEDLAKESTKDYAKDFFKDCLKKVIRLPEPDVQKEAYGKALKEFLQLAQQELENAGYQDAQIKSFNQPLKQFIQHPDVATTLGQAFESDCRAIANSQLAKTWKDLDLPYLPDDFDWDLVGKLYVRIIQKKIIQESETLRLIFSAQAQASTAAGVQELVGIAPDFNLRQYAEGLREAYGTLKLDSLDTNGVYYSELKLWKMFIPQSVRECQEFSPQVYELPKEHVRRLQESGQLDETEIAEAELEHYRKVYAEQPIRPLLEVVGDSTSSSTPTNRRLPLRYDGTMRYDGTVIYSDSPVHYAVILGDPGSGKSSLLQYIALVWAERSVIELSLYPIPLLIELRTYARDKQKQRCQDILSFIHSGNVTCRLNQQQLHERLQRGEAIALFDGIDEVFDPVLRDEVVTDIHRFTNRYPNVQVIATSRWLGYKAQRLRDAEFRHFMLQELDEEQIEAFIQRWHDLTFPEGADKVRKRDRLQKATQDSKAIRELAGNPLLLTMMAILNRNQELPRDRPELYSQASLVLLHQWDVERNLIEHRLDPTAIDYRDKQAILQKVAYYMQSSEKGLAGNIISASDLEGILTDYLKRIEIEQPRTVARLLINQLRTRNFILCYVGSDSYAFVHRTFLEYFCAREFINRFEKHTLTESQLIELTFIAHWKDEKWHEVLCLIAGMVGEETAGKMISFLNAQDGNQHYFINLILATQCLSIVRNQSLIKPVSYQLLKSMKELTKKYEGQVGPGEEVRNSDIFHKAISGIISTWKQYPETLTWLKSWIQESNDPFTSKIILDEIIRNWSNDPRIFTWIKSLLSKSENLNNSVDSMIRGFAFEKLCNLCKDDPEVLPLLRKNILLTTDDAYLSSLSITLFQHWKNDSETLDILIGRLKDKNVAIRFGILQGIVVARENIDSSYLKVKEIASLDEDNEIRWLAVRWLSRWKNEPDLFDFLCDLALHDPFKRRYGEDNNPRQASLKVMIKAYPDHPQTLELLRDRATNDPDEQLREWAQQQLTTLKQKT
ncbi:NACHT domain-containing protein [Leptothoe sp. EHU-05/26/07-4]